MSIICQYKLLLMRRYLLTLNKWKINIGTSKAFIEIIYFCFLRRNCSIMHKLNIRKISAQTHQSNKLLNATFVILVNTYLKAIHIYYVLCLLIDKP